MGFARSFRRQMQRRKEVTAGKGRRRALIEPLEPRILLSAETLSFSAAAGAVSLYHVEGVTPEAKDKGRDLLRKDHKTFVFDDVEVLDFAGPFEVFSRVRLVPGTESRRSDASAPYDVFTVARTEDVITTTGEEFLRRVDNPATGC